MAFVHYSVPWFRSYGAARRAMLLKQGVPMTKILAVLLATLVAVSVAGCAGVGKGKAPPVVTKG